MFIPARPPEMSCKVVYIFAAIAGLCTLACMVAQILTRVVASASADIIVIDSSDRPQWSVVPPKPRHFAIDMMKSRPICSECTAARLFQAYVASGCGAVVESIHPPFPMGRKIPYSFADMLPGLPWLRRLPSDGACVVTVPV